MLRSSLVTIATTGALGLLAAGTTACHDDQIVTVSPPPVSNLYWDLRTDIRAVTLAVGGTQQLTVTPVNALGAPLAALPKPSFTSSDTTKVTVSPTGLVTGVAETRSNVNVIASLAADGVTYVDTIIVAVTPQSAVLKGVRFDPPPNGTTISLNDGFMAGATAIDANDQPIPGAAISIVTLDTTKVHLFKYGGPPYVQAAAVGKVRLVAMTTSYGISKSDTMEITVQYLVHGQVSMQKIGTDISFNPDAVLIGVGGTVTWSNYAISAPVSIVFTTGEEHVTGGNISSLGQYEQQDRTFPVAGTYLYKDTVSGATGKIVVSAQPQF